MAAGNHDQALVDDDKETIRAIYAAKQARKQARDEKRRLHVEKKRKQQEQGGGEGLVVSDDCSSESDSSEDPFIQVDLEAALSRSSEISGRPSRRREQSRNRSAVTSAEYTSETDLSQAGEDLDSDRSALVSSPKSHIGISPPELRTDSDEDSDTTITTLQSPTSRASEATLTTDFTRKGKGHKSRGAEPTKRIGITRAVGKDRATLATYPVSILRKPQSGEANLCQGRPTIDTLGRRGPYSAPLGVTFSHVLSGLSPEHRGGRRNSWNTIAPRKDDQEVSDTHPVTDLQPASGHPSNRWLSRTISFLADALTTSQTLRVVRLFLLGCLGIFQRSLWPIVRSSFYGVLGGFIVLLVALLVAAAYVQWFYSWMPGFLQTPIQAGTDFGSRVVCTMPGVGHVCVLVCRWDDYTRIFPTVCQAEGTGHGAQFFDDAFNELYGSFSQVLGLNGQMYAAPKALKEHRNTLVLKLDEVRGLQQEERLKRVNFNMIEVKMQTILDLSYNLPENLYIFLHHVGSIPDVVLYQTNATRASIERKLRNESEEYHSTELGRRRSTPQEALRHRFYDHVHEWKTMVEWLLEPGEKIYTGLKQLETECLSLKGMIKTATKQIMSDLDITMGHWSLSKRLGVHFGVIKPPDIQYLADALQITQELLSVISDLLELFSDLWNNTMAINTNLNTLLEVLRKSGSFRNDFGEDGRQQLEFLLQRFEVSAQSIRNATRSLGRESMGSGAAR